MADSNPTIQFVSKPTNYPCFRDLEGQRFARLLVIGYAGKSRWWCRCDCGTVKRINMANFAYPTRQRKDGSFGTQSCGCLYREMRRTCARKNGEQRDKIVSVEYRAYITAKNRCKPDYRDARLYYGRGIRFKFESFEQFLSCLGRRPAGKTSLDRIDNDGHYEPGNVRWADAAEQNNNKRSNLHSAFGVTKPLKEWLQECGISRNTYYSRRLNGWCENCCLTLKRDRRCKHKQQLRTSFKLRNAKQ